MGTEGLGCHTDMSASSLILLRPQSGQTQREPEGVPVTWRENVTFTCPAGKMSMMGEDKAEGILRRTADGEQYGGQGPKKEQASEGPSQYVRNGSSLLYLWERGIGLLRETSSPTTPSRSPRASEERWRGKALQGKTRVTPWA